MKQKIITIKCLLLTILFYVSTMHAQGSPDYILSQCFAPIQTGGVIQVHVDVLNAGSAPAADSSKIGWYLSTDDNIDTNDFLIRSQITPPLDLGPGIKYVTIFPITNVPPGNYYLGTIVDYENSVAESNEENNIGCVSDSASITISGAAQPDFAITNCDSMTSSGTLRFFNNIVITAVHQMNRMWVYFSLLIVMLIPVITL